jgi:ankyrin
MEQLVTVGSDVNVEHLKGHITAFWASLQLPEVPRDVVRFLLDSGLRVDTGEHPPLFGILNENNTPLHFAAHRSFAEILIKHGADVFAKNLQGKTPLHTACEQVHVDVVELLISHGAIVSESTTTRWTPILFTAGKTDQYRFEEIPTRLQLAKLLVLDGADTCAVISDGLTALHRIARSGEAELVRYLIEQGEDACAATSDGETSLHSACSLSNPSKQPQAASIVQMLIDHGADLKAKDNTGATPLFLRLLAFSIGGMSVLILSTHFLKETQTELL